MSLSIGELVGYVDLDTGPAEGAADKLGSMFGKLGGSWGKLLAGAGVMAGGLFAASLAGAINMEPSRDRVAAALDLTSAEAERAGKVSAGLYSDAWGESAEDVDVAVEAVMSSIKGMRSASEGDLRATTEAALTLSTAMGVDVSKAAQVAGNMIASGLAKNGVQAMDLLASAMSKVPVELREDILDATDEYGQFFAQVGMTGPQAMGLLAAGAKKGMYGIDKAGDAVKEFTIRSTDMSATSKAAYDAIGLDAGKMAKAMLAGGDQAHDATQRIVDGLLNIKDPAKRANASIALFGTPLEDLGTKQIPTFLRSLQDGGKELGDFGGATKRMGDTLNDNASTNLTEFTRHLKMGFVNVLGGTVLPIVTDATGKLNNLGPAFGAVAGFIDRNRRPLGVVAGLITAVFIPAWVASAATATASAATTATAWVVTKVGAARAAAAHSVAVARMVAGWVAMGVRAAVNAARIAAAWLVAMGPVGWVIAGLVAVGAGFIVLWRKSETFRNIVKGALHAVGEAGKWLWNRALAPAFRGIVGGIGHLLAMWAGMLRALSRVPGFGWAKTAANAMQWAADKANGLAAGIRNINDKTVTVRVNYVQQGLNFLHGQLPVPKMATGGRVTSSTIAMIGEGREPESVLPDSVLHGLLERAHNAGREQGMGGGDRGRGAPLIGQVVQAPGESADTLAERLWFKTRTRG